MKRIILSLGIFSLTGICIAQNTLTPEALIQLGKVTALGVSKDPKAVVYAVKKYSLADAKATTKFYSVPIAAGTPTEVKDADVLLVNSKITADGKRSIGRVDVKGKNIFGSDHYPDLPKSDVMIYDNLNQRHWDTWEDGAFGHVFLNTITNGKITDSIDLMKDEPYDCPQKPSGGDEDFIWSPDGKQVLYVTKKKYGKDYAVSTNTDIYAYNTETKTTTNLTEGMMGYDVAPAYSSTGMLAFLSMK